jgi:hypothetical protein
LRSLPICTKLSSDSSMVDEYAVSPAWAYRRYAVQIPLWSMNT